MSMCRVFSCVVGRGCLLWPVHFLGKTLLAFALLHSLFQGQICWLLQVFLPTFALQSPIIKRTSFLSVSFKSLVGLHRTVQLQLLQHYWLGHRHIHRYMYTNMYIRFPGGTSGKEPTCQCRRHKRCGFDTWVGNPLQFSCLESPMDRGAW